jgi:hypothetical protein
MVNFSDGSSPARHLESMGTAGQVELWLPNGRHVTCESASVGLYPDGLAATTGDGTRLFAHVSGTLIIDAPAPQPDPAPDPQYGP